jgi:hypothetical protein
MIQIYMYILRYNIHGVGAFVGCKLGATECPGCGAGVRVPVISPKFPLNWQSGFWQQGFVKSGTILHCGGRAPKLGQRSTHL